MSHLSTERLAGLSEDAPSAVEAAHLHDCAPCAREREAFVALRGMAHAERGRIAPPLTQWEQIAPALPGIARGSEAPPARDARVARRGWPLQIAAGLLLAAGGAMLGRASAGARLLPDRIAASAPAPGLAIAAALRTAADSGRFASADDARAAQARSQQLYEQAAAFLAEHEGAGPTDSPVAYRSRLAALDRVISTTREALRETPHDPVMNDYYLTTIGQREATLRQLNTALPASLRLNSF